MQFTADLLRRDLHTSEVAESSPLGAALCGTIGHGVYAHTDEIAAAGISPVTNYTPTMPADRADAYYAGWSQAVNRVL